MNKYKIIIVDDHPVFRKGIKTLLESLTESFEVVAECNNGLELFTQLEVIPTNLILLDIKMPHLNGIETMKRISKEYPHLNVLILTAYDDLEYVKVMFRYNVKGYLLKSASSSEIILAINKVIKGDKYCSYELTSNLSNSLIYEINNLTKRELQIFKLLCQGLSSNKIAEKLFISPRTVDTHKTNIFEKTNCNSIAELILFALRETKISVAEIIYPPIN